MARFLAAWRALPGFPGDVRFRTWLYRIAIDQASGRPATDIRRRPPPLEDVVVDLPDLADRPPADIEAGAPEAFLERCVAELPPGCRAAVVLRDIEGLTSDETAAVLGLMLADFRSRLHEGRMEIRGRLEDFHLAGAAKRADG